MLDRLFLIGWTDGRFRRRNTAKFTELIDRVEQNIYEFGMASDNIRAAMALDHSPIEAVCRPSDTLAGTVHTRVYIIILNWNSSKDTIACLNSIEKLRYDDFRVVLCDNASDASSVEELRRWAPPHAKGAAEDGAVEKGAGRDDNRELASTRTWTEYQRFEAEKGGRSDADGRWTLIHTGDNLGYAGGCNVGIRYALARRDAGYFWILNNDTVVEPDALDGLVRCARRGFEFVGSTVRYLEFPDKIQCLAGGTLNPRWGTTSLIGYGLSYARIREVDENKIWPVLSYINGASMLVTRGLVETVGLMEEDYFLYYEELDWVERARRILPGVRLGYAVDSVILHQVGATIGTERRSLTSVRYLARSRLKFMRRFYPNYVWRTRLHLLWESLRETVRLRIPRAKVIFREATSRGSR